MGSWKAPPSTAPVRLLPVPCRYGSPPPHRLVCVPNNSTVCEYVYVQVVELFNRHSVRGVLFVKMADCPEAMDPPPDDPLMSSQTSLASTVELLEEREVSEKTLIRSSSGMIPVVMLKRYVL